MHDKPEIGEAGKREKTICDESISRLAISILPLPLRGVIPDFVKIGLGALRETLRHQRRVVSPARSWARPRSFTSSASCRMGAAVTSRPSPRAREALASSSVRRKLRPLPFTVFPQSQGFLHGIFFGAKPSAFNRTTGERLLI
jgi:hypothetical protein